MRGKYGVLFFAVLFCLADFCCGSPSIDDYGKLPTISKVAISPDGDLVAFRKTELAQDYLVVFDLKQEKIVRAVDVSSSNPTDIYFLNESNIALVVSEYKTLDGFEGKHNVRILFRVNIKSGDVAELLTPGYKVFRGQLDASRVLGVSEDGKYVYMAAYLGDQYKQDPPLAVVEVDIDRPRRLRKVYKGKSWTRDFFINSGGEVLVEERYSEEKDLQQIVRRNKKKWSIIYEDRDQYGGRDFVGMTPDLSKLVFLSANQRGHSDLHFLSLNDASISEPSSQLSSGDIDHVYIDDQRVVFGVRYSGFSPSYTFFDSSVDEFAQFLVQKFEGQSVWIKGFSEDKKTAIIYVEGSQYVGEYYVASDSEREIRFLASSRPNITPEDINPVATFEYSAADGLVIPTLLTIPKSKVNAMTDLPAVLLPHGGPAAHDRVGFDFLAQVLASRGYLVVQPQFRGSTGFGLDFYKAGLGEWGKKMQTDLSDALAVLSKKGMIDPERVCIVGWSYGGYAALAGGAFSPELYKCVVSINGVSDLPKMMWSERNDMGSDSWVLSYWSLAMANGDASNEKLKPISPAYFAHQFKAPVLLIHGERDKVVPIRQSRVMYSQLKEAGKNVQLIVASDDNHGLIDGENRVKAVKAVVEFVDSHIGK